MFLYSIFLTSNIWIFYTKQFSCSLHIPTGCPRTEFNYGTNYPDSVQTPQVQGSTKLSFQTQIASSESLRYLHLWQIWLQIRDSHNLLLRFDNLLLWHAEPSETPYSLLVVYYKGCKWTTTSVSTKFEVYQCLSMWMCSLTWKFSEFLSLVFLWTFHYIAVID